MATPLSAKLKLKPNQRIALLNAPDGYLDELAPLPDGVDISTSLKGKYDLVQVFVKNQAELARVAAKAARALKPISLLWVSYPKGTSKIQTDLTRDMGWEPLQAIDLMWVNLISINDTWSAFALRPYKPGEARRSWG